MYSTRLSVPLCVVRRTLLVRVCSAGDALVVSTHSLLFIALTPGLFQRKQRAQKRALSPIPTQLTRSCDHSNVVLATAMVQWARHRWGGGSL